MFQQDIPRRPFNGFFAVCASHGITGILAHKLYQAWLGHSDTIDVLDEKVLRARSRSRYLFDALVSPRTEETVDGAEVVQKQGEHQQHQHEGMAAESTAAASANSLPRPGACTVAGARAGTTGTDPPSSEPGPEYTSSGESSNACGQDSDEELMRRLDVRDEEAIELLKSSVLFGRCYRADMKTQELLAPLLKDIYRAAPDLPSSDGIVRNPLKSRAASNSVVKKVKQLGYRVVSVALGRLEPWEDGFGEESGAYAAYYSKTMMLDGWSDDGDGSEGYDGPPRFRRQASDDSDSDVGFDLHGSDGRELGVLRLAKVANHLGSTAELRQPSVATPGQPCGSARQQRMRGSQDGGEVCGTGSDRSSSGSGLATVMSATSAVVQTERSTGSSSCSGVCATSNANARCGNEASSSGGEPEGAAATVAEDATARCIDGKPVGLGSGSATGPKRESAQVLQPPGNGIRDETDGAYGGNGCNVPAALTPRDDDLLGRILGALSSKDSRLQRLIQELAGKAPRGPEPPPPQQQQPPYGAPGRSEDGQGRGGEGQRPATGLAVQQGEGQQLETEQARRHGRAEEGAEGAECRTTDMDAAAGDTAKQRQQQPLGQGAGAEGMGGGRVRTDPHPGTDTDTVFDTDTDTDTEDDMAGCSPRSRSFQSQKQDLRDLAACFMGAVMAITFEGFKRRRMLGAHRSLGLRRWLQQLVRRTEVLWSGIIWAGRREAEGAPRSWSEMRARIEMMTVDMRHGLALAEAAAAMRRHQATSLLEAPDHPDRLGWRAVAEHLLRFHLTAIGVRQGPGAGSPVGKSAVLASSSSEAGAAAGQGLDSEAAATAGRSWVRPEVLAWVGGELAPLWFRMLQRAIEVQRGEGPPQVQLMRDQADGEGEAGVAREFMTLAGMCNDAEGDWGMMVLLADGLRCEDPEHPAGVERQQEQQQQEQQVPLVQVPRLKQRADGGCGRAPRAEAAATAAALAAAAARNNRGPGTTEGGGAGGDEGARRPVAGAESRGREAGGGGRRAAAAAAGAAAGHAAPMPVLARSRRFCERLARRFEYRWPVVVAGAEPLAALLWLQVAFINVSNVLPAALWVPTALNPPPGLLAGDTAAAAVASPSRPRPGLRQQAPDPYRPRPGCPGCVALQFIGRTAERHINVKSREEVRVVLAGTSFDALFRDVHRLVLRHQCALLQCSSVEEVETAVLLCAKVRDDLQKYHLQEVVCLSRTTDSEGDHREWRKGYSSGGWYDVFRAVDDGRTNRLGRMVIVIAAIRARQGTSKVELGLLRSSLRPLEEFALEADAEAEAWARARARGRAGAGGRGQQRSGGSNLRNRVR